MGKKKVQHNNDESETFEMYNSKIKHLKVKKKRRNQALLKDKHDKSTMIEKCHGRKKGATQQ